MSSDSDYETITDFHTNIVNKLTDFNELLSVEDLDNIVDNALISDDSYLDSLIGTRAEKLRHLSGIVMNTDNIDIFIEEVSGGSFQFKFLELNSEPFLEQDQSDIFLIGRVDNDDLVNKYLNLEWIYKFRFFNLYKNLNPDDDETRDTLNGVWLNHKAKLFPNGIYRAADLSKDDEETEGNETNEDYDGVEGFENIRKNKEQDFVYSFLESNGGKEIKKNVKKDKEYVKNISQRGSVNAMINTFIERMVLNISFPMFQALGAIALHYTNFNIFDPNKIMDKIYNSKRTGEAQPMVILELVIFFALFVPLKLLQKSQLFLVFGLFQLSILSYFVFLKFNFYDPSKIVFSFDSLNGLEHLIYVICVFVIICATLGNSFFANRSYKELWTIALSEEENGRQNKKFVKVLIFCLAMGTAIMGITYATKFWFILGFSMPFLFFCYIVQRILNFHKKDKIELIKVPGIMSRFIKYIIILQIFSVAIGSIAHHWPDIYNTFGKNIIYWLNRSIKWFSILLAGLAFLWGFFLTILNFWQRIDAIPKTRNAQQLTLNSTDFDNTLKHISDFITNKKKSESQTPGEVAKEMAEARAQEEYRIMTDAFRLVSEKPSDQVKQAAELLASRAPYTQKIKHTGN